MANNNNNNNIEHIFDDVFNGWDDFEEEDPDAKMQDLIKRSKLNVDTVIARLQLNPKDVLNVYIGGSRLWGTASYNSDWDILVVVKANPKDKNQKGKMSVHSGQDIDATVYTDREFSQCISEHSFLELACLWLPPRYVWKEQLDLKKDFKLDPLALQKSILEETHRDWLQAQKYFEKQNAERGRKTIVHAFRLFLVSLQILEHGHITDFYCTCKIFRRLKSETETSWEYYNTKYTPIYNQLQNILSQKIAEVKQ